MRTKLFDWDKLYKPTEESSREQEYMATRYRYYGIPIGVFGSGFSYTKDEMTAMILIHKHKDLPDALANKLLATKEQREHRFKATDVSTVELTEQGKVMEHEIDKNIEELRKSFLDDTKRS